MRTDGTSAIPFASPGIQEIYDLKPSDVRLDAAPLFSRIHPDDLARVRQRLLFSAETMSLWSDEYRVRHPEKGEIWVAGQASPARETDGAISWFGFVSDVTERKHAEEVLRRQTGEKLELLQTMVERAPIGIVMLDRQMFNIQASQRWLDDFHLTRENALGRRHFECLPDLPSDWQENYRKGLDGETLSGEDKIAGANGQLRWLKWRITPWGDSGEINSGIIVYIEDLTEQKQVAAIARQRELQYSELFEHMSEGIASCRMVFEDGLATDFVYMAVNPRFESLTGLKDVIGRPVSELIPGIRERDPDLIETFGRVALTGKSERFERFLSGFEQWYSISVYSLEKGFFVTVFDVITERKKAETAARQWQRAFEQSASGIALGNAATDTVDAVNPAYARLVGYTPEELKGRPFVELYSPEELTHRSDALRAADSEAGHALFESRLVRKGRESVPCFGRYHGCPKRPRRTDLPRKDRT